MLYAFEQRKRYNQGQAMLTAALFFVIISLSIVIGLSSPTLRAEALVASQIDSKQSYALAESLTEDITFRLVNRLDVDEQETLLVAGHTAYATTTADGNTQTITTSGDVDGAMRVVSAQLVAGSGASFNYGVQTHVGGFVMENSSSIRGNLFSNGTIVGSGNSMVYGDVISAGPDGYIAGIHATGTVWARVIEDSEVDGDAYYQTISNTAVEGVEFPGSPDQATSSLPIGDAQVEEWKSDALSGGVITGPCPYEITSDETIGPVKIPCDLIIRNKPTVTVAGAVWVEGNITFSNTPTIVISPLLDGSVPIVADDPNNRITGSQITINNANEFIGNGEDSYVLLLSQNESAEEGGDEYAIEIGNSADGDLLLYAGHGEVRMQNSASLKEVSAWRVRLQNTAEVVYETGLANTLFTSGPAGGYEINTWQEIE